ncbi:MAG: helix-turn-helix transcriptional regulator [Chloroflexi bacterium]|nr:helix-turn-helix transcriptional regulator [Chloroflexota bacterium]
MSGRHSSWKQVRAARAPTDAEVNTLDDLRAERAFILGERLVEERQRHGWSQADVAGRAGVSMEVVDLAELGDADVPVDVLDRIGYALGLAIGFDVRVARTA